ncbi:MAG: hypothetical protein WA821_19755 [Anaerolineales bacterium]
MSIDTNKPGLSIAVTTPPTGPATEALSEVAKTPESRQALVCFNLLDGKTQQLAANNAAKDLPDLLANNQALLAYGNNALAPMNALIDAAQKQVRPVEIPELNGLMSDLGKQVRSVGQKYDLSNPKVAKWVHDSLENVKRFGFGAKSIFEELLYDAKNIYQKLDTVKSIIYPKEMDAVQNVGLLDQFYQQNEKEILAVIYTVAVMEQIRDLAKTEAGKLNPNPNTPADHDLVEKQRNLTEFANNMNLKIAEFDNRLFLGWANGPQLTNSRTLNLSLAVRLNLLTNVTLYSVKFCIEQWEIALQEQQMAQLIKITDQFANEVMQTAAKAGAGIAAFAVDVTQTPSLSPETISMMAASIAAQADATAKSYNDGFARQLAANSAMLDGQKVIANSQLKVSQAVLNGLITKAQAAQESSATEQTQVLALASGVQTAN